MAGVKQPLGHGGEASPIPKNERMVCPSWLAVAFPRLSAQYTLAMPDWMSHLVPVSWLALVGAALNIALGLNGLLRPAATAAFTSIAPVGRVGVSEIRATYGGLFLALGLFALASGSPVAFHALGWGWLGAALGRVLSIAVDASRDPRNLGAVAFEAAIAGLLLAG